MMIIMCLFNQARVICHVRHNHKSQNKIAKYQRSKQMFWEWKFFACCISFDGQTEQHNHVQKWA